MSKNIIKKNDSYRSMVFSVLKIQFGWGGVQPDGCNYEEWEQKIEAACINNECVCDVALYIADDINDNGGSFLERLDGKQNLRLPTRKINNFIKNDSDVGNKHFSTLKQAWKAFYRAHRVENRTGCRKELAQVQRNIWVDDGYEIGLVHTMLECVFDIFYPRIIRSAYEPHKFNLAITGHSQSLNVESSDFDEDMPF